MPNITSPFVSDFCEKCAFFDSPRRRNDSLRSRDILLVYEHGTHVDERETWLANCETFKAACGGAHVSGIRSPTIAGDVALLWATHE
jgi:hypothetical protein